MRLSLGAIICAASALIAAASVNGTQPLRECFLTALVAGGASARIVDASNNTSTDARLGEKIQLVSAPQRFLSKVSKLNPLTRFDGFHGTIAYAK
jgi:hypothetical protein